MNIFSNNLKANFVPSLLPTMCPCPAQRMQFHHSTTSPLKNFIENNVLSGSRTSRTFKNPNFFACQRTETALSNYKKNNLDIGMPSHQQSENDVSKISVEPSKSTSRKRSRKTKQKTRYGKSPEKHNTNRQVVQELMDVSDDSTDYSFDIVDEEMDDCRPGTLQLCDLLVLPDQSTPLPVIELSPKCPLQTTCFALSISPPTTRQRQCSTTESEDSFIVFESGTDEECDFSEDDACSEIEAATEDDDVSDSDSPSSVIPTKKVRFAKDLCEVHPMIKWSFAYQAARKGPWESYARDRERFKNRIRHVGEKIGRCLESEHRRRIFDQRFNEE